MAGIDGNFWHEPELGWRPLLAFPRAAMGLPPGLHSLGEVDVNVDANLRATVAASNP